MGSRDGIFTRKGALWISYTGSDGKRHQERTYEHSITAARDLRTDKLAKARKERALGYAPPSPDTFAEYAPRYLAKQKAKMKSPKAFVRTKGIVETHLMKAFGKMRIADIREKHAEHYIEARTGVVGPASIVREVRILQHLISKALGKSAINHVRGVELPEAPESRLRYIQPEHFRAVLEESPEWLRPIALLLVATGMRRGEVLKMTWQDVDLRNCHIVLPGNKTKTGTLRTVKLNELALAVFSRLPRKSTGLVFSDKDYSTPENVSLAFLRACRRAKVTDFRLHDLRHTCASWMSMKGASLQTVADQLGHKSLRMTMKYSHLAPAFQQTAVSKLDEVFPPGLAEFEAPKLIEGKAS
jgi:integrase